MGNELEVWKQDAVLMPASFDGMMAQADVFVKSGLLPQEVKTAAQAVVIMVTGRELGIPAMQAFRGIYVVKGKPTISAQLMGALIWRAGHSYHVDELTNDLCRITFKRRGQVPYTHTFTIKDAQAAGLAGSQTWKAYTKAMLFSRCMSAGARVQMPDVISGMYTPEEIAGADNVVIDAEGEVVAVVEEPSSAAPGDGDGHDPGKATVEKDKVLNREKAIERITELANKAHELTGGKRYNAFHLTGHLKKHFDAQAIADLTNNQLVVFGTELAQEVRDLEVALEAEYTEDADEEPQPALEL